MLTLQKNQLPDKLTTIVDAPHKLFIDTNLSDIEDVFNRPAIAIVGTRAVSPYGVHVTRMLSEQLAKLGIVIVSGLALGVDSIAHESALSVGGTTIAVLPGGIARIYPRSHETLGRRIISKEGMLISEHDGTYTPAKHDFLIRNRLVAGLADAVLVTEAAERSGTLNTVNHALDQGKTIFAVPGNITSPTSVGTNQLIKVGSIPVTGIDDILYAMDWNDVTQKNATSSVYFNETQDEKKLLELIGSGVSSGEKLALMAGLDARSCNHALTMLELSGVIRNLGSNQWAILS